MSKSTIITYICLILLFIQSAISEPNDIQVTHFAIKEPKLQGIRVVFISDVHFKKRDYKKLKKVASLTLKQNPDIILFGGDYVSSKNPKNNMSYFIFANMFKKADAPMISVLGEADWKNNAEKIKAGFESNGIRVLENSSTRLFIKKQYIDVIGLADNTMRQVDMAKAFKRTNMPRIVLSHNPDVYYDIMDEASVILAGHTHGGQFILPFTPPMFVNSKFGIEFASGEISKTRNHMIISKGIGTSGLPLRLNCKPEIIVVDFTLN